MKRLLETIMLSSVIVYGLTLLILVGTTISEGNMIPVYIWIGSGVLGVLSFAIIWIYEQGMKDASKKDVFKDASNDKA